MADKSGQADIRGINIQKLAKGFADEALVLKNFVLKVKASAREIRWYKKTAGFLTGPSTTGITGSTIAMSAAGALPFVEEQSWTRQTSYVRKYFIESPTFSMEDLMDNDVALLATNVRDLVQAVANQVDSRILAVLGDTLGTGGNVNTAAATQDGWDDTATGDPIKDVLDGLEQIRIYRYDTSPGNVVIYMHPTEYSHLMAYLINVKGSSIPDFASEKVRNGVCMSLLGCQIVVSTNMSTDTVVMFVKNKAATWYQFTPLQTAVVDDPGIGKKIRVWEEGECTLDHPRAVHVITDTAV